MTFDPLRQVKPFRVYKLSQLNPKVDIVSLHYMLIGMIVVDDQTIIEAEYIGLYFLWSASQGDWWVTDYRRQNIDKALMSLNSCFSSFWLQIKEESVSRFFVRVMQIQVFFSLKFHFILEVDLTLFLFVSRCTNKMHDLEEQQPVVSLCSMPQNSNRWCTDQDKLHVINMMRKVTRPIKLIKVLQNVCITPNAAAKQAIFNCVFCSQF